MDNMRTPISAIVAACAAFTATLSAAHAADTNSPATQPAQPVWDLTAHAYRVLSKVTFFEAIDKAGAVGLKASRAVPTRSVTRRVMPN